MEKENEQMLMNGSVILSMENTVYVKYQLPQIAAIAESLVVLSEGLNKLTKQFI